MLSNQTRKNRKANIQCLKIQEHKISHDHGIVIHHGGEALEALSVPEEKREEREEI